MAEAVAWGSARRSPLTLDRRRALRQPLLPHPEHRPARACGGSNRGRWRRAGRAATPQQVSARCRGPASDVRRCGCRLPRIPVWPRRCGPRPPAKAQAGGRRGDLRVARVRAPATGTMSAPCASAQAMASCAGVAFHPAASGPIRSAVVALLRRARHRVRQDLPLDGQILAVDGNVWLVAVEAGYAERAAGEPTGLSVRVTSRPFTPAITRGAERGPTVPRRYATPRRGPIFFQFGSGSGGRMPACSKSMCFAPSDSYCSTIEGVVPAADWGGCGSGSGSTRRRSSSRAAPPVCPDRRRGRGRMARKAARRAPYSRRGGRGGSIPERKGDQKKTADPGSR